MLRVRRAPDPSGCPGSAIFLPHRMHQCINARAPSFPDLAALANHTSRTSHATHANSGAQAGCGQSGHADLADHGRSLNRRSVQLSSCSTAISLLQAAARMLNCAFSFHSKLWSQAKPVSERFRTPTTGTSCSASSSTRSECCFRQVPSEFQDTASGIPSTLSHAHTSPALSRNCARARCRVPAGTTDLGPASAGIAIGQSDKHWEMYVRALRFATTETRMKRAPPSTTWSWRPCSSAPLWN